jgi:DNA-binding CsgD family transcriptional regulator
MGKLTLREIEIVNGIRRGLSNKEIGKVLGIAPTTVKSHIENICGKLGVRSRLLIAVKGPNVMTKPFAYFDRNTSSLRFETARDLRNARIGEPREIALYTGEQIQQELLELRTELERIKASLNPEPQQQQVLQ